MAVKMRNRQVLIWAFLSIVVLVNDVMPLAGNALETIREEVAEGESVVLDCDLEYDPNKELYWVQDLGGTALRFILQRFPNSSPEHIELHHPYRNRTDITLEGPEGTSLRIGSVRRTDNATNGRYYECQQPQGDKRKSRYELHVTYHPDPPTDIGIRGVRLYSFNISCTASDGGGLSQKLCLKHLGKNLSIICKEDIDQGEEVQFSVKGLNYSTSYQLCVYAENQLGSSGCGQASVVIVTTEAIGQFYAELKFLNVPFTSSDLNDQRNRQLVYRLNKTLIGLLQPSHPDLTVEVTEIRQGSVKVTVLFKGVQKELETIKGTLKEAVTGGDLAHLGVDPHYFHTFAHRKAEKSTPVWIPILGTVATIVLLTAGGLLLYWKLKKRATEVTNVPEPTTYFESEDFKRLSQQLEHSNICIVHGQLGIGKSQAVMNFVKQFQAKTKSYVIWFIGNTNNFSDTITNEDTGLSQKTVLEKLLEFVEELKESGRPVNIKQGEKDIAKICDALKDSKNKCLLVFDDVQDISVIPRQLLTPWPELTILITTMDETLGLNSDYPEIPRLKMKGFSQTDVVSFLTSGNEDNVFKQTDHTVLRELAHQFAFLPLGLSLAKCHILGSGTSVQEYLHHLHQQSQAMGRGNKNLSEPERNIFAAVQLLLTHRMDEASRQVLQLMAFLMPNNIPTGIISEAYWHLSGRELNVDEFIKAVRKLSLGQVTVEKKTVMRLLTIHQLTQRAVLDMLYDKEQDEMICALVKAFLVLFTKDTREIRVGHFVSQLYPHLLSLLGHPTLSLENLLSVENSEHLLTALIRLNEVLCYLYCQQRHPDRAMDAADKAKRLCNHICKDLPSEHISEVYGKLKREGLDRFQNDVYGKTVTRQLLTSSNIDVLKLKVPQDVADRLALMAESFQPLSKEQYCHLITYEAALNEDQIKALCLIELVASVFYTSGRILFYLHGDRRKEYFETAWKELHFSHNLSREFASDTQVHLLNEMLSKRAGILYLLKEKSPDNPQEQKNDLLQVINGYKELISDQNTYFEYGILKKVQKDDFHAMFCYRSIVDSFKRLAKLTSSPDERRRFFLDHNNNAKMMIGYAEKQGTRDQEGRIIDGLELLPEVYNMRAQFIIDMYEAGFKDDLPEDDRLSSAAEWANKALGIMSCKPLRQAKAYLLLASASMMAYNQKEDECSDHEESAKETATDEKQPLMQEGPTDKNDMLAQTEEYLNQSRKIFKEFPNAVADIDEANTLMEKLMKCKDEATEMQAPQSPRGTSNKPNQEELAARGDDWSLNGVGEDRDVEGIEMKILP